MAGEAEPNLRSLSELLVQSVCSPHVLHVRWFSTTDSAVPASPDWDILIVGRSIVDALDPATAAKNLVELVHPSERHR
ncbi:hypothetical protein OG943_24595 [Amycolatopsis sp. NBC_00345]|uniref:hypothetical protein n=1 Tax=Amycolatopsis sp. NBC_00345 TaxID=2975955 RepID=UPI002E270633